MSDSADAELRGYLRRLRGKPYELSGKDERTRLVMYGLCECGAVPDYALKRDGHTLRLALVCLNEERHGPIEDQIRNGFVR